MPPGNTGGQDSTDAPVDLARVSPRAKVAAGAGADADTRATDDHMTMRAMTAARAEHFEPIRVRSARRVWLCWARLTRVDCVTRAVPHTTRFNQELGSGQNGVVLECRCTLAGVPQREHRLFAVKIMFNFGVECTNVCTAVTRTRSHERRGRKCWLLLVVSGR